MYNGFDFYAIEPASAARAEARVRRIIDGVKAAFVSGMDEQSRERKPYEVAGGVAIVRLSGLMVSSASWFDEADMSATGTALKAAATDPDVRSILLAVDSPGGEVTGTIGLADITAAVNSIKPVTAHIAGVGASAAYWVSSQASSIVASRMARVGSIGVAVVMYDTSAMAEAAGVRPVVVATSPLKVTGADGVPITDEMTAEIKRTVEGYEAEFKAAIKTGRGIDPKTVATGQTWFPKEAKALGLIDKIGSFDETLAAMMEKNNAAAKARTAQARGRAALLD